MSVFKPRNDIVLIRVNFLDLDPVTGLQLPQQSPEAVQYFVEAVGPKVESLLVGDRVEVLLEKGSFSVVPRHKNLIIVREANIALVHAKQESH